MKLINHEDGWVCLEQGGHLGVEQMRGAHIVRTLHPSSSRVSTCFLNDKQNIQPVRKRARNSLR